MSGKKGMKHYPKATKLEAVRMFLEEGLTRVEVVEALGLPRRDLVKVWVRQFRRKGGAAFAKPKGRPPRRLAESPQEELERLRMENALLKKFLTDLRMDELAPRPVCPS